MSSRATATFADGAAFAVVGEDVGGGQMQPDLGVPGVARPGGRAAGGKPGCVAVVPSGLDQQPAGVPVPGERDVPAVLLITGGRTPTG